MRCAAHECGPLGIRVNTVNPGAVETRMIESIEDGFAAAGTAQGMKQLGLGGDDNVRTGRGLHRGLRRIRFSLNIEIHAAPRLYMQWLRSGSEYDLGLAPSGSRIFFRITSSRFCIFRSSGNWSLFGTG